MVQTIEEILNSPIKFSTYKGSKVTRDVIAEQIKARWGEVELKNYDPYRSALTFASWLKIGYRPKHGEKAMKSTTYVEVKDNKGKIIRKQKRGVNVFYYRQVVPLANKS